jgi:hypothetical protein
VADFELRRCVDGAVGPSGVGMIGPRGSSFLFPAAGRDEVEVDTDFELRRWVDGTAGPCGVGRIGPRGSSFLFPAAGREEVDGDTRFSGLTEGTEEKRGRNRGTQKLLGGTNGFRLLRPSQAGSAVAEKMGIAREEEVCPQCSHTKYIALLLFDWL